MSNSMPTDVIIKIVKKFDEGTELKINKYAMTYRQGNGYKWSFIGTIGGQEARLTLYKDGEGKYVLKKVETKVVEEFMQRNIKIETEETL